MSAFEVTNVSITVDHFELGVEFMNEWDNEQQAQFFLGVAKGLKDLGHSGYAQLLHIADAAKNDGQADELEHLADRLSEYFRQEP